MIDLWNSQTNAPRFYWNHLPFFTKQYSSLVCRRLGLYLWTKIKLSQTHGFSRLEKKEPGYERFFFNSYLLSCFSLSKLIVQSNWLHTMYFLTKQGQFPALRFFSLQNFTLNSPAIYKLIFREKHVIRW